MLRHLRMAALAVAMTLVFGGLALADEDDYYRGNPGQARQYGYQQGYSDGFRHGREDRAENEAYNLQNDDWEDANRGYADWMGPYGQFKRGYRDGYRKGYDAAFYRNRGWWGRGDGDDDDDRDDGYYNRGGYVYNGGYGNSRYNRGYQDGMGQARRDISQGKPFNPNPRGGEDRGYEYNNGYRAGYQSAFGRH
jgi:hypothetical protein